MKRLIIEMRHSHAICSTVNVRYLFYYSSRFETFHLMRAADVGANAFCHPFEYTILSDCHSLKCEQNPQDTLRKSFCIHILKKSMARPNTKRTFTTWKWNMYWNDRLIEPVIWQIKPHSNDQLTANYCYWLPLTLWTLQVVPFQQLLTPIVATVLSSKTWRNKRKWAK